MSIESITKIGQLNIEPVFFSMSEMPVTQRSDNFLPLIAEKISSVDSHVQKANGLVEQYLKGDDVAVHDVLIAMGKAKTDLQLAVEIRNKVLESYQEITKIQL